MAFSVPTLQQLITRIGTDLGGFSDGTVPRGSVEYGLARALSASMRGVYGYQTWRLKQQFPDTADERYFWRWASIFGMSQKQAVSWKGTYEFTGANGTVIAIGSELQRADGQLYTTDAEVTISGGTATAALTASSADALSNNDDAQELSLSSPISGVDTDGEVQSTTQTGTDVETAEEGLVRLLQRLSTTPSGGGTGDYVRWALEVPGVTRAWEFANVDGVNTVSVAFVRDGDGTGTAILPDSGERATVLAYLQTKAPITVTVVVITLTAVTVDVVLSDLDPNTSDVRDAISTSVSDLLYREGGPGSTVALSRIDAAISDATGELSHVRTTPAADVVTTNSQIAIVGTVSVVP